MAAIAWQGHEDRARQDIGRAPLRLVTAPPSRRRPTSAVYRRRRLVVLVVGLTLLLASVRFVSGALGASASAGSAPATRTVLVAQPGDSYWSLAAEVHEGGDLRSTVDAIVAANGGRELHVGDRIALAG